MRISYSRYSRFVSNPESYRLYYGLGLIAEDDDVPTRMNLGRRRGSCFHAMYEGVERAELIKRFGKELVERCDTLLEVVPNLGELFFCEKEFEVPIGDGKHSIHGFIDHGFFVDGHPRIGDFKTTKGTRTKKELNEYLGTLETSPQKDFYLKASSALGFPTDLFTYHIILDRKDAKTKPSYLPMDLQAGRAEVDRTMAAVYAACEAIEFYTNVYGVDKPWPHSNSWPCTGDKFFCKYAPICGRTLPKGCAPPGFTTKYAIEEEDD